MGTEGNENQYWADLLTFEGGGGGRELEDSENIILCSSQHNGDNHAQQAIYHAPPFD